MEKWLQHCPLTRHRTLPNQQLFVPAGEGLDGRLAFQGEAPAGVGLVVDQGGGTTAARVACGRAGVVLPAAAFGSVVMPVYRESSWDRRM